MMQRFWSRFAVTLGRRAGLVAVIGLLVTLALGAGISRLEFATGQDSYLEQDSDVYRDNVDYQALFGGQAILGVITMDEGHSIQEVLTGDGAAALRAVHDDLGATGEYQAVVTPIQTLEFTDDLVGAGPPGCDPTAGVAGQVLLRALSLETDPAAQAARSEASQATLARVGAVPCEERTLDNPAWVDFLLHDNAGEIRVSARPFVPDDRHATILVRMQGNLSLEEEGELAATAQARLRQLDLPNASLTATGAAILLKDLNDYLRGGMLLLGGVAAAVMVVILLVLFDVRWRLLPLAVILVGVVWAFGAAGYLGIPLTIATIAGLPVMLGVGIDYAIQLHARVEEEVVVDRSEHPIQETARALNPALLVVTFDAIFAFAALGFAKVPMIRQFGLLLAVGIAVICLCSIVVPTAVLGIREFRSPTTGKDFRRGALGRFTELLGRLPESLAVPLALLSVVIFVGGILVEDDLDLQTDPIEWVDQDSETVRDIHTVQREVRSSSELGVFVQSDDVFSDETVAFLHAFAAETLERFGADDPEVPVGLLTASSVEATLAGAVALPGTSDVVPLGSEVRAAYEVAPPDIQRILISPDGTAANLVFRVEPGSIDDLAEVVDEIRTTTDPPEGITATPSGLAVVGVGLLENLEANRVLLTYLSMAFVFAFLAIRLRSLVRALLSLVPVAIAVGTASLVAYVAGFDLSPLTAVGGPLVVALCTEFTSLILLRFIEERHRGFEPREAVDVVAQRTGRAFIVSGLTAIAGVAVISLSSLPLLRDFGRIVGMNVAVALLSALVVLPPLLVWAERRGWVTRGMRPPEAPMVEVTRT